MGLSKGLLDYQMLLVYFHFAVTSSANIGIITIEETDRLGLFTVELKQTATGLLSCSNPLA